MKLSGKTDIGLVRRENQDDFRAADLPGGAVWGLVCDGMGGAKGGRTASRTACEAVEKYFFSDFIGCALGDERAFLTKALETANRAVYDIAAADPSLQGMGTTAVCALLRGGRAYLCHAGDSRAYLYRDSRLEQITRDHSYVQELVDCGTITPQEADHHPQKNIITKALGVGPELDPEYTTLPLRAGDRMMICSDGLSNMLTREQMEEILGSYRFYDIPDALIAAARSSGGRDNITALLIGTDLSEDRNG